MFDIGFWELIVIGVVALLVIGPERLPGVARTAGMWVARARRFVSSVQADINMEISKTEELKRLLEEQASIKSAHEIIEQTANEVREGMPVPAAKPDYALKAMSDDKVAKSQPARSVSAAPLATPTEPAPTPSQSSDNKHDQSA